MIKPIGPTTAHPLPQDLKTINTTNTAANASWEINHITYKHQVPSGNNNIQKKYLKNTTASHIKTIELEKSPHCFTTSKQFLSVGIDTALAFGDYWWKPFNVDPQKKKNQTNNEAVGKFLVKPLNFNHPHLIKYMKALGPTILRIGGTAADSIHYFKPHNFSEPNVTKPELLAILNFAKETNSTLLYTIGTGPQNRDSKGNWDPQTFMSLLTVFAKCGHIPKYFEFGNENNAHWFVFGPKEQRHLQKLAQDYAIADEVLHAKTGSYSKLAAPANMRWPLIGEPFSLFTGSTRSFLKGMHKKNHAMNGPLTIHFYASQSSRSKLQLTRPTSKALLKPRNLQAPTKWLKRLKRHIDKYQPNTPLWISETASALCGGEPGVSDSFISSLWWLDFLGMSARQGVEVVTRHSMIGSDYSLLDEQFNPRPDYWTSLLWNEMMGNQVFSLPDNKRNTLRTYCHNTPPIEDKVSIHNKADSSKTVLSINVGRQPQQVSIKGYEQAMVFLLEGNDTTVSINGKAINSLHDFKKKKPVLVTLPYELPTHTAAFIRPLR